MAPVNSGQPSNGEYVPYYDTYIRLVPDGDLLALLDRQIDETVVSLSIFTAEQAAWRPASGEWNMKEIVGHLADAERVFAYRALSFARNDPTPLPGMDQNIFMAGANFADRPLADVVAEFAAVRRASVALLRSLDAAAWARGGTADGNLISVRALAYIIAGHALHHARDFPRHRAMGNGAGV
ncbi:MAG: DinB family protein [Chloroflexota bacterium]|nr:DinB family protein [Chloroflexota bacterium]